ncbi:MAG TPA: TonB-dependent siderophore receptor [Pseudomonas sabulinigri]|uniref:TonB-dependent receptor plug domain-containing protein n=1 Tax=marine sediment metagenome TaxID=412755 RepID=A0A0F9Y8L9_9ZZZZ|nr:TonB-dependent siderophore receptor [Halopseudomonas sabulinigri]HEC50352.1 TonB-dependent siderophore receptor [Halopseudomonas sabulinigri]
MTQTNRTALAGKTGTDLTLRKSGGHHVMATSLALAISGAMIGHLHAAEEEVNLDTLVVEDSGIQAEANPYAEEAAPYKARVVSDSRHTRDIADTPQTITVITKSAIEDSGKTELKDILSAQPGITLGTGEGGNSFGDRYIIRGYEARSDIYTDGLRDPGLITRETFALEQIEIAKGPSSTFAGRGSTGGAVNSVTKKANIWDDFTTVEGGLGTDEFQRYTLDTNKVLSDELAIRFNGLYTEAEVPDRGPAEKRREGALISGVYQPLDEFKVLADYYYSNSDDRTDPGVAINRATGEVDDDIKYVGQSGLDFQKTSADIFTLGFEWELGDGVKLENKSRVGNTQNDYIISIAQSGGLRTFSGWQENDYIGNQTNLTIDKFWGDVRHTVIIGGEYANEKTDGGNYTVTTDNGPLTMDPYNPDNNAWVGSTSRNDAISELELQTLSAYVMDTITLSEDWEVFGGLRYDQFDYDLYTAERTGRGGVIIPEASYDYNDGFWNGHMGVVYSPWEHGNVYLSWSTSSNINGGEADAAASCGYGGLCTDDAGNYAQAEPEQSTNWELGTKWNLLDHRLLLTAAVFQTTKDDVIEEGVDSYSTGGSLNTGKNRVHGVELGLAGNITDKLSGQIGAAIMNSETLKSYDPANEGLPKANFAEKSANAQLRYQLTPAFGFGGVVTYSSEMFGGQPDAGANGNIELEGYTVYDLFASYRFTEQFDLRANLQNVFDDDYYTATYRGGSIVYKGDARNAQLTARYKF